MRQRYVNSRFIRSKNSMATRAQSSRSQFTTGNAFNPEARQKSSMESENLRVFDDEAALAYPSSVAECGKEYSGVIFGYGDWCDFFVRPDDVDIEVLTSIQTGMNDFYGRENIPTLKSVGLWMCGSPCAVRYVKDQKWYRGRLEDPTYGLIRFVDYGNTQLCGDDVDVKPLTRSLAEIAPPACIRCSVTQSQDMAMLCYDGSSNRIRLTVLRTVEPYEVRVLSDSQTQSDFPDAIQMVMENLMNEMKEVKGETATAVEETLLDTKNDDTDCPTVSDVQGVLRPIGVMDNDTSSKTMTTTAGSTEPPQTDDQATSNLATNTRYVGVQTDGIPFDTIAQEMRKLRSDDKDLLCMMKLALCMEECQRKKFYHLLEQVSD